MLATIAAGAERAGRFVHGERLLGLAGVARAQHGRVGGCPSRQLIAAHHDDRSRRAIAEHAARERAADRRAAHAGDDQTAWRVVRLQPRRLDPPQRVAQLLGQVEDVVQLTASIDLGDRLPAEGLGCAHELIAPSGTTSPGKIRAPRVTTLPDPTLTCAPITTSSSIRQSLADHGPRRDDRTADRACGRRRGRRRAPRRPGCAPRNRSARGCRAPSAAPTLAPGATSHPAPASTAATS